MRATGIPTDCVTYDEIGGTEVDATTMITMVIGRRDKLTETEAQAAGAMWRKARMKSPQSPIAIMILGYDQDPRELWEFPEVCRYVQWWAAAAGMQHPEAVLSLPDPISARFLGGFLASCGVYGEEYRTHALSSVGTTPSH